MTLTADKRGWGDPYSKNFERNIVTLNTGVIKADKAKFPKLKKDHPPVKLRVNKEIEYLLRWALFQIITTTGYRFDDGPLDDWGYVRRPIRGYETKWRLTKNFKYLSNHSWGLAVDLNSIKNPMSTKLISDIPKPVIDIMLSYGFEWGGNYRNRKDPMHFEFTGTLEMARHRTKQLKAFLGEAA